MSLKNIDIIAATKTLSGTPPSFRNIYDIFDDIADIYFDLTSTEQAGLLETIAGKFLPEYTEMCI